MGDVMFIRRIALIVSLLLVGTACAVAKSNSGTAETQAVPVGGLPPTLPTLPAGGTAFTTVPRTTVALLPTQLIGAKVTGNRVIMIGDSVMAGTAKRYGGEMCAALVPLGWAVEVDAETARFIDFGNEVLKERLPAGWDAAVIFLGNNYGNDPDVYRLYLNRLVEKLAPRPTVLITVSEYRAEQLEVNTVIFEVAAAHDNVVVIDWATLTAAHREYLRDDGLHLKDPGRAALAQSVADVFGPAPTPPGTCLGTNFYNDGGGSVDGSTTTVGGSTTSTSVGVGSTTTEAPTTTAPPSTPPSPPPSV
ncbi:MAG: hypothetical protein K8R99_11595 [Actinomycetia bacterium]|nr:hypothetical protein [Actinomycetes bacterium]